MYLFFLFKLGYIVWWDLWYCDKCCVSVFYVCKVNGMLGVFSGGGLIIDNNVF